MEKATRETHEQLRIDHILVLEELEKYKEINERLTKELENHKHNGAEAAHEQSGQPDAGGSLVEYVEKIRKQDKEIQDLKTIMRRTSADDQQRFNTIHTRSVEEFTQQLNKIQQRERELTLQVDELTTQLETMASFEQRNITLMGEVTSLRAQLTLQTATASARAQDLLQAAEDRAALQLTIDSLQAQLLAAPAERKQTCPHCEIKQSTLRDREVAITDLERECENLQQLNREAYGTITNLHQEVQDLNLRLTTQASAKLPSVDFGDSDSDDGKARRAKRQPQSPPVSTAALAPLSSFSAAAGSSPIEDIKPAPLVPSLSDRFDEDDQSVITMGQMSVRFQEYIRLKRENKELKLRLADRQACGGGSTRPNPLALPPGAVAPLAKSQSAVRLPAVLRGKSTR